MFEFLSSVNNASNAIATNSVFAYLFSNVIITALIMSIIIILVYSVIDSGNKKDKAMVFIKRLIYIFVINLVILFFHNGFNTQKMVKKNNNAIYNTVSLDDEIAPMPFVRNTNPVSILKNPLNEETAVTGGSDNSSISTLRALQLQNIKPIEDTNIPTVYSYTKSSIVNNLSAF